MNLDKHHQQNVEMGFAVHHFLIAFNQTFYKSGYESFENFFLKNKNIKKWMVFSDYVFDNKNKQNDKFLIPTSMLNIFIYNISI